MDILLHLPAHRVMVCLPCGIAVAPHRLQNHLKKLHLGQSGPLATRELVRRFVIDTLPSILDRPLLDPRAESVQLPATDSEALPGLKVHTGLGCNHCAAVCKNANQIRQHYNTSHAAVRKHRGGPRTRQKGFSLGPSAVLPAGEAPQWHTANYQRFFGGGRGSQCFRVKFSAPLIEGKENDTNPVNHLQLGELDTVADRVIRRLKDLETSPICVRDTAAKSEVSPWLERTRWTNYFEGHILSEVSDLGRPIEIEREPLLRALGCSVDRLVEAAYITVCSDKVNYFGQRCISSFLPAKKMYSRPLLVKLQAATYKRYKESWKRLLAFVYRSSICTAGKQLRHRLTSRQTALFDKLLSLSRDVVESDFGEVAMEHLERQLDDACLDFCIALLDHDLKGDLFESSVLGYLATMGIDTKNSRFYEAQTYTPMLSGFIKISQMLVLQKAISATDKELTEEPMDVLEEMRERFMTIDCRSPFSWAVQLRSFGKKIRDSITSLGYIQWSDDEETLFYKDLELQLSRFRSFVASQVKVAQLLLEGLFMLHPEEKREDIVPPIRLHLVRDDPTVVDNGWNFLHDDRNRNSLPNQSTWLLRRVLDNEWLRDDFTLTGWDKEPKWRANKVQEYKSRVNRFLEHLLLLIHITSGQPARGTEIISLRHTNTMHHRNIFIEDGLVAIVTSYHKGYTCTGSTKIIHRYLPKEVGELLVYYLWLIFPFTKQLSLLTHPRITQATDAFLWSRGGESWNSQRLTEVLKRETHTMLGTPLTISVYRHVAIAISRRHLQGGGFRRDYDVAENTSDRQTTHNSWTAGRLYARGLEEAPGHVEARRSEFRAVSRRWHAFLGFSHYLGLRKRPLQELCDNAVSKRQMT